MQAVPMPFHFDTDLAGGKCSTDQLPDVGWDALTDMTDTRMAYTTGTGEETSSAEQYSPNELSSMHNSPLGSVNSYPIPSPTSLYISTPVTATSGRTVSWVPLISSDATGLHPVAYHSETQAGFPDPTAFLPVASSANHSPSTTQAPSPLTAETPSQKVYQKTPNLTPPRQPVPDANFQRFQAKQQQPALHRSTQPRKAKLAPNQKAPASQAAAAAAAVSSPAPKSENKSYPSLPATSPAASPAPASRAAPARTPPTPTTQAPQQQRERNRLAAGRCRARSKRTTASLLAEERAMREENGVLAQCVDGLRRDVLALRHELLRQGECSCPMMTSYMLASARAIVMSTQYASAAVRGGGGGGGAAAAAQQQEEGE